MQPELKARVDAAQMTLRTLLREALQSGLEGVRLLEIPRGKILMYDGDPATCAWFLMTGRMRIFRISAGGTMVVLAHRSQGDLIGELSMIDGGSRSGSAIATEDSSAVIIPRAQFENWLNGQVAFAAALAIQLSQRLRETSDRAYGVAAAPIAARMAAELLARAKSTPDSSRLLTIDALSVTDLAASINATRESVSKTLSRWVADGLVSREGTQMVLRDPLALTDLLVV